MSRHVVVVGSGPAGLGAAAGALRAGARVTLLDAAEDPGGQYHRMPPAAFGAARPGRLHHGWRGFERLRDRVLGHPRCAWWPESAVWSVDRTEQGPPHVHVLRGEADGAGRERHVLRPDGLVLAPGAHDRVLPFPGWELPGVYTAGAAQALAKGERLVVGDPVLIAGSGPFLLPVAASLIEAAPPSWRCWRPTPPPPSPAAGPRARGSWRRRRARRGSSRGTRGSWPGTASRTGRAAP
ncbi:FAD-dependent oxidoreductase [Actinomadura luteofluorescens]|uniref:FAD-dependent oxidoreductase n=1 Tax=Actinomadura luteofluorescens TaxID=46163 RepID=UPI0036353C34